MESYYLNKKERAMKNNRKDVCRICGRPFSVILGGKNGNEKLCFRCLVVNYPALKVLTKEM